MIELSEPAQPPAKKKGSRRGLTPRQEKFVRAIIEGKKPSEAHQLAGYAPSSPHLVSIAAQHVLKHPLVQAKIAELKSKVDRRSILSLSERLELLSANAKLPNKNAAHRNAQARVIEVLTKIAGDGAPELPPDLPSADGTERPRVTRIVIDIFKNSPSHARATVVSAPEAVLTTNGNGNGRH